MRRMMVPEWLTQLLYDLAVRSVLQKSRLYQQFLQLLPPMPPTYSPPPVSPTHGDQIEVPMITPKAQGPGLVSPSKTQQDTQFGPGATSTAGQFPLCRHPVRGQGTPLDLRHPILISPQESQITLTVENKLIDYLPYLS